MEFCICTCAFLKCWFIFFLWIKTVHIFCVKSKHLNRLSMMYLLWNGFADQNLVQRVVRSLENSGLIGSFGIATSLTNSGQQWLVVFFRTSCESRLCNDSLKTCSSWIHFSRTTYLTGAMQHVKLHKTGNFAWKTTPSHPHYGYWYDHGRILWHGHRRRGGVWTFSDTLADLSHLLVQGFS